MDTIMTILGNYIRMNGKKMTKKNSSRLFVAGILTAAICLAFSVAATSDTHYSIEIIEVNGGYGYQISHNNHITIFQPFIPAISGKKPFMEKLFLSLIKHGIIRFFYPFLGSLSLSVSLMVRIYLSQ